MRSTMPGMSTTWEEHQCFVVSEVSYLWLRSEFWLTLYRDVDVLFIALDANFRLRCRAILSNENDPSLSQGWSYFVEETTFKTYLHDHKNNIQEVYIHMKDVLMFSVWSRKAAVRIIMQ